jgi:hypothetical protein
MVIRAFVRDSGEPSGGRITDTAPIHWPATTKPKHTRMASITATSVEEEDDRVVKDVPPHPRGPFPRHRLFQPHLDGLPDLDGVCSIFTEDIE